ncbi:MAG: hypothetical protein LBE54_02245 [Brucellaceae bacterium]|jgi:hypothetical protein|nr:hypothetical protein [Brucellaceae bacterium]
MRTLFALFLMCGTANAACNDQLLEFVSWSIKPLDADTNEMTAIFKSHAEKPIKMIDASAGYKDALGGRIGSFALERDVAIAPGGSHTETGRWGQNTFERLLKLKPEEVTTSVCVRAVLYDDGTKETFQ